MDAESRPQEGLRRHLLRRLVLQVPDAVAVRQRLEVHAALGLDADLEPASVHSRGASDGRVDGVTVAWSREDAIAASSSSFSALTQRPPMLNSKFGLSFEYTETKEFSHSHVVKARGNRFWTSQKTARPKFTSCFMRRMRWSRGQHFLLL